VKLIPFYLFVESSQQPEVRRHQIVDAGRVWGNINSDALYRCTDVIQQAAAFLIDGRD
jgi:hypothetical protein